MPLYEYRCCDSDCKTVSEVLRRYSERELPVACKACGAEANVQLSVCSGHSTSSAKSEPTSDQGDAAVLSGMGVVLGENGPGEMTIGKGVSVRNGSFTGGGSLQATGSPGIHLDNCRFENVDTIAKVPADTPVTMNECEAINVRQHVEYS